MFERIIDIDRSWLLAINGAHAPWADSLFWSVSQPATWLPLYAVLIVLLALLFRRQRVTIGRWHVPTIAVALAMIALAVGAIDLICAQLVKPLVARPRPTHDAELSALIRVLCDYRGGAYGFCSNHAANTMACATLCAAIFTHGRSWYAHLYCTLPLMAWVVLNCYSRMYLGVHYPLDILAGVMVGWVIAWGVWLIGRHYLFPREAHEHPGEEA